MQVFVASSAGVHGKGFTVIAKEVGNLANDSRNFSEEIYSMLQGLENEVIKLSGQFNQNNTSILEGSQKINLLNGILTDMQDSNNSVMINGEKTKEQAQEMIVELEVILAMFTQIHQLAEYQSVINEGVFASSQEHLSNIEYVASSTEKLSYKPTC